jgi:prolyl oligopeptidase
MQYFIFLVASAVAGDMNKPVVSADDPNLWLEEVMDEAALGWVRDRNAIAVERLAEGEEFQTLQGRLLSIFESDDRIPMVAQRGAYLYNFWRDAEHPVGLWRRTTMVSYKTETPDWDVLLDLDDLAEKEGENWVWHGSTCLPPDYTQCLLSLSRGGADADVVREFDLTTRDFVEGGFFVPEAKSRVGWVDSGHLFVATDFGEGSLTESGYPRVVKHWQRGTPLEDAVTVYEGETEDISVGAWHDHTEGYGRSFVYRGVTFWTNEIWEWRDQGLRAIHKPPGANVSIHRDWVLFELRKDWDLEGVVHPAGSLLAANYPRWMKGKRDVVALFTPSESTSLAGYDFTRDHLVLNTLEHVRNKLDVLTPPTRGKGAWTSSPIEGLPEFGTVSAWPVDAEHSNQLWFSVTDYVTPSSLWLGEVGEEPEQLKTTPERFDASGLRVSQHFATSKDGTQVPYFQVAHEGAGSEGDSPTLLYGYGGFEISLLPSYKSTVGAGWLERGGIYVVANIRGGGEYGPRWHQAALRENRHRAYEDFVAVAEDLVARGVTRKERLGIQGGSNGGLLMGNMYTLYPEHWGAVVCQVPLLDMKRYTHLLAGASWAGEYGDPDTEDWSFVQTFSPYHNIDADQDYPPILFTTSTRDDRVHPAHARKMAAALLAHGKDVTYYENIEGGHGGAANNEQASFMNALAYTFLWEKLTAEVVGE